MKLQQTQLLLHISDNDCTVLFFFFFNLVSFKYIILYRLKRLEFHEAVQTPSPSLPM